MRYNGGKTQVAAEIAAVINSVAAGLTYWEPFVGAGSVLQRVRAARRLGSDLDGHIIAYLTAIRDGWLPPESLSEEEWATLRACRDCAGDALVAFAGYGCSFAGKFFAGYGRYKTARTCAQETRKSAEIQAPLLSGAEFSCAPYWEMPFGHADVIYCDPPYAGTTRCGSGTVFDSDAFWAWARERARESIVLVSEFSAPSFAVELRQPQPHGRGHGLRTDAGRQAERLFLVPSKN